ncbi:uncharacterized protein K452DRAFT_168889 [Aplosporella prunicola CBS 121167]|uniref:FAD-binding FR-type domain-containing protein n=1 Tax=Aplosporella prunicola CBS 121167 TaxID=1176127 RepID=A0A6A6BKC6_9PEZI|nr:uncharacterized protein K452DRAFT_168889 [Aplosporella prunicola CBS 121167]KAF2143297.1 hypothetical protein K452DRAFT_168889 [Aplosporella prunicola CBS 121167]
MQQAHPIRSRWTVAGDALVKRASDLVDLNKDPFAFSHGLTGVDQTGNYLWVDVLLGSFLGIMALALFVRMAMMANAHLRHVSVLGTTGRQVYWGRNQTSFVPWVKKHLLYAPLWKGRHNEEIRLSSAVSIGTLPSRFHFLILVLYGASNVAYCLCLPWGRDNSASVAAALRGRSGTLAALNLIPTILFALRNNPLIWILHVSYDTFNLLHRWAARIVIIETIVHTLCWLINTYNAGKWSGVSNVLATEPSYAWGMVGTVAFVVLGIQAWSPLRHAFYETFLNIHRVMVVMAIVGAYAHIDIHGLPQLSWMQLSIALWGFEWAYRTFRIVYYNMSTRSITKLTIEALPNDACRVTCDLVRNWNFRPGSHVHIYIPSLSLWASHPFSVAWSSPHHSSGAGALADEKLGLPMTTQEGDVNPVDLPQRSISLVIRAREGMTRQLYDRASKRPGGILSTYGMIEGPYGGHESLDSYGTCILFAAGVGITHQVCFVRHLVNGYHNGTVAARKIVLVWTIPNTECLEWVRPWMDEILRMPGRRECLKILLFVTRPKNHAEVNSSSGSVQMFPGRCDTQMIIDREVAERIGAVAVTVCGAGAFSDGVRKAVRQRIEDGSVDFIEEAFTY